MATPTDRALAALETKHAGSGRVVAGWHRAAAANGLTVKKAEAYLDLVALRPVPSARRQLPGAVLGDLLLTVASGVPPETVMGLLVRHDKRAYETRRVSGTAGDNWDKKTPAKISGALLDALDALDAAGIPTWEMLLLPVREAIIDGDGCGFGPGRSVLWAAALDGPLLGGPSREGQINWRPDARTQVPDGRPGAWAAVFGPDGHRPAGLWYAAGFSPAETAVLHALPETHPDRPGPDQLAVMAALRGTHGW